MVVSGIALSSIDTVRIHAVAFNIHFFFIFLLLLSAFVVIPNLILIVYRYQSYFLL